MSERTTKYVTVNLQLILHGNYIDAEDIGQYLDGWLSAGLEDRDDLRSWTFDVDHVRIETGDPEGYDS